MESTFKRAFNKTLEEISGACFFNITDKFSSGIPDTYVFVDGKGFWIEYKVENNKPTKLQENTLKKLAKNGICSFVVKSKQLINDEGKIKRNYIVYSVYRDSIDKVFESTDRKKTAMEVLQRCW